MRAVTFTAAGGPDVLECSQVSRPEPGPGQVLIALDYAGINRPDALQRAGLYKPPRDASPLLGLEGAGRIVALGANVSGWQIGDAVCALLAGGGYAEYAVAEAAQCLPVPPELPMIEAACLPETLFTCWSNLIDRAQLKAGERLLVHGGGSGIGTTAIQLARLMGAQVFVTAGSAEKCAACLNLGAAQAWNYKEVDFVPLMRAEGGADVILDMVGGSYLPRNIKALANDGRLVQIAFLEGSKAEVNFAEVMMRRLTITGSTLRPRSPLEKAQIAGALRAQLWPHVLNGRLRPVIEQAYPLEEAALAHRHLEERPPFGKLVFKIR